MLEFRGVGRVFRDAADDKNQEVRALENIDLAVSQGEFVCLLGPSGCGKSTILNLAAGFLTPTEGLVTFRGSRITGPGRTRSVVFQESGLIPWLTVEENIRLAIKGSNAGKGGIVDSALDTVGLKGFHSAMPHELSGGMKQKAAIARSLAMRSDLMLMDEPFASLDEQTRLRLNREMIDIWRSQNKTIMFITHSIQEAVVMGTRVVLLSARPGRIKEEWVLEDEGKTGEERQKHRLNGAGFVALTSEIRNSMDLCCPPGESCGC